MTSIYNIVQFSENGELKIAASDDLDSAKEIVNVMFRELCAYLQRKGMSFKWKKIRRSAYIDVTENVGVFVRAFDKSQKEDYYISYVELEVFFPYRKQFCSSYITLSETDIKNKTVLTEKNANDFDYENEMPQNYWRVVKNNEIDDFLKSELTTDLIFENL